MFRGANSLSMDGKGRLALPVKYRKALSESDSHLILTAHPHRCILVYLERDWLPIQEKLMALSSLDKQVSALQRLLVGHAEDVEIDGTGRLLVSAVLRQFAGLDKQVMLVGQGKHFELWDSTRWHEQMTTMLAQENLDLPEELNGFSL